MQFLDRNTLPRFQERLDLSASELNDAEDILTTAINELAGRIYILANLVDEEERHKYAEETNCKLLTTIDAMQTFAVNLESRVEALENKEQQEIDALTNRLESFERRLNALDDAAARKQDLAVVLWRTAVALNKGDMNNDGRITLQDVILLLKEYQGGGGDDIGPEPMVYTASTCENYDDHPFRIGHNGTIRILNDNINDLKHRVTISIYGSVVDSYDNAIIDMPKGRSVQGILLPSSAYAGHAGQNALWITLETWADAGEGEWEYIGSTTNKFDLID